MLIRTRERDRTLDSPDRIVGLRILAVSAAAIVLAGCRLESSPAISPLARSVDESAKDSQVELPAATREPRSSGPESASAVALVAHQAPTSDLQPPLVAEEPLPPGSSDAAPRMTLVELETTALANNPAVAEATAVLQALQGRYEQAGLGFNPTAGYMATMVGENEQAGMHGAFVQQEFIRGNKLGLSQAVVSQEIRQAQQRLTATRLRVQTDVRLAHFDLLVAQRRLEIANDLQSVGVQAVDAVDNLVRAGRASGADLLQAEIESETAEVGVETSERFIEGAWRRLAASMGTPDLPIARVEGSLEDRVTLADYETIVARTVASSPQLAAAVAGIDRARWAVERARAEAVPNVTAQASVQYDYGSDDAVAGVQVGLPLPIYNWNQGGVREAIGELREAEYAASRMELAIERELSQAYQDYVTARIRAERFASDILPRAADTLDLTRNGYRNGEATFLQLLTAQRTYFQTNLAYLDALSEMGTAGRRMNGLLLSDSLRTGARSD